MANTQTTVPTFIPGQVLTATQMMNSAATGVPVFATTVTRDAGFGGTGEKTLAEGQLCYLESTNVVQYYDGAAWATLAPAPAVSSALTLLVNQALSGTSTTLTNIFSATYKHYLVKMDNVLAGSGTPFLRFRLGAGTLHCYTQLLYPIGSAAQGLESSSSGTTFFDAGQLATGANIVTVHADFMQPFLTLKTGFFCYSKGYSDQSFATHGVETSATSFTDLTISNANGTSVTGNIQVYGYSL
tara:strand:+ start:555 stop:1280 length:726 start_codon:yes stop_codon:yes gene_type:complete